MSKLAERIGTAKAEGRAALIAYLPVGYPDVDASIAGMVAAVEGGADIVEIGVPYSDPGMDGPVIQQAVDVAVRAGVGMRDVLKAVEAVAAAGAVPVVMSYWNPIERYGVERFATDLAAAGGAGAITPDLIPDEAGEWIAAAERADLDRVFLVAPSSTDARLASTTAACRPSETPRPTQTARPGAAARVRVTSAWAASLTVARVPVTPIVEAA